MSGRHRKPAGLRLWPVAVGAAVGMLLSRPAPEPAVPQIVSAPAAAAPTPVVRAVAAKTRIVPIIGAHGLTAKARSLASYVQTRYPQVRVIGGWRPDPLPDHPSGRAIDIMVDANTALGDRINADLRAQRDRFGITYTLWRVPKHFDHVHVTVVAA